MPKCQTNDGSPTLHVDQLRTHLKKKRNIIKDFVTLFVTVTRWAQTQKFFGVCFKPSAKSEGHFIILDGIRGVILMPRQRATSTALTKMNTRHKKERHTKYEIQW